MKKILLFILLAFAFDMNAQCDSIPSNLLVINEGASDETNVVRLFWEDGFGEYRIDFAKLSRTAVEVKDSVVSVFQNELNSAIQLQQTAFNALIQANTEANKLTKLIAILEQEIGDL
jgi:hypothetical protein